MLFLYLFYNSDGVKKKEKNMTQFVNKKKITQTDIWGKKFRLKTFLLLKNNQLAPECLVKRKKHQQNHQS